MGTKKVKAQVEDTPGRCLGESEILTIKKVAERCGAVRTPDWYSNLGIEYRGHGNFTVCVLFHGSSWGSWEVGVAKRDPKDEQNPKRAAEIALCRATKALLANGRHEERDGAR
jgi:hypothetical protein